MKVPNCSNRRHAEPVCYLELHGFQPKRCLDSFFKKIDTGQNALSYQVKVCMKFCQDVEVLPFERNTTN